MEPILIRLDQGAGDAVMASAAIRDLQLAYPGRFRLWIDGRYHELFKFDPNIEKTGTRLNLAAHRLSALWFSDRDRFVPLWHGWLADCLNIPPFQCTANHGKIVLSPDELKEPPRFKWPYIVVNGGIRSGGFEVKGIEPEDIAAAVRAFPEITFVHVGSAGYNVERIAGTLDLVGQTTLREMATIVHHSWAVISPVSFLMHLAAAVPGHADTGPRNIITLAGGAETPWFYGYHGIRGVNHYIVHTIGQIDCCKSHGCWIRNLKHCQHREGRVAGCVHLAGGELVQTIRDCLDGKSPPTINPVVSGTGEQFRRASDGTPLA